MVDRLRFPSSEIVDLYSHRWEIELGYREIKQTMLDSTYHLRALIWSDRSYGGSSSHTI